MSPRDITIDIPIHSVKTHDSAYSPQSCYESKPTNEKSGMFHRRGGGRRKAKESRCGSQAMSSRSDENEEEFLTNLGKIYNRIYNFSLITRYLLCVFPLAIIIAVPIIVGATIRHDPSIGGVQMVWLFTWIECIWLSLWISKLWAKALPTIFQTLCGIVSSGTRKYVQVLKALEIPLSLVGWALASWGTFIPLMTCNPDQRRQNGGRCAAHQRWQTIVSNVAAAFLVASLVFLVEKLLVQMISMNYHRKQFASKIKTSKRNIHLLSLLYDASRALFPTHCPEFAEEDHVINDSLIGSRSKKGGHTQTGSATPMKIVHNVAIVSDKITSAFGNVAQEITGREVFNPTAAHSIVITALEKHHSCEALAKRLWMSFVVEGREALFREDLIEVLGEDHQQEAEEAFNAIDADLNGDISLDEMIMAVAQFGRDRHSIANSVHDVDQAIKVLDQLLQAVVVIAIVLVFVGFLNASFTTTLATAGTALLSLSFVFASTAAEVLGSCIFLFVKHPYDVGDRVDISKESLTVEHISLLFSVFKRVDNHKTVQIPNIVLNQGWIENISRSNAMREQINLFIHFETSLQDIQLLKDELQAFVIDKENSRDFQPEIEVEILGIAEMNKLELRVEIKHKSNWSNETLRATRRSKFMCALVLALRKVPIYAPGGGDAALGDFSKPTYAVTVSDDTAAKNREAFAAKKEAKRFVPSEVPHPEPQPAAPSTPSPTRQSRQTTAAAAAADPSTPTKSLNESVDGNACPSTIDASERTAVDSLHCRTAGTDAARDDWDNYREGLTSAMVYDSRPAQETTNHSPSENENVRGRLHRESSCDSRRPTPPPKPSLEVIDEGSTSAFPTNQNLTAIAMPTGLSTYGVNAVDHAYQLTPSQQSPVPLMTLTRPYENQKSSAQPVSSTVAGAQPYSAGPSSAQAMRSASGTSPGLGRTKAESNAGAISSPGGVSMTSAARTGNAFAAGSQLQSLSLVQQQRQQNYVPGQGSRIQRSAGPASPVQHGLPSQRLGNGNEQGYPQNGTGQNNAGGRAFRGF